MGKAKRPEILKLGLRQSLSLVLSYVGRLLKPQFFSIGLVVAYLVVFQIVILGIPVAGALGIGAGTLLCMVGLSSFLEGLFLGIIPLGSQCGMRLPAHAGSAVICAFAFILGVGATFAEPAIGFLRAVGSTLNAWDSPLLYTMLNRYPGYLTLAIAIGVGIAATLGILRFLKRLPFKPIVCAIVPAIIGVSFLAYADPRLRPVLGLAWDSGGITTGPVTVPLILALGTGMSRVIGKRGGTSTEGFGVVTLAAFIPVLTVIAMGAMLAPGLPEPTDREAFFRSENRSQALCLFPSPESLDAYAKASMDEGEFDAYLLGNPDASDPGKANTAMHGLARTKADLLSALQAIIPLSLLLLSVLLLLKEKIRQKDELLLGVALAVFGLFFLNWGMNSGLSEIGRQTGAALPASYLPLPQPSERITIKDFDAEILQTAIAENGDRRQFFTLASAKGPVKVEFDPAAFDPYTREYVYVPVRGPLFGPGRGDIGKALILFFAFMLGYMVTVAEPGLSALGSMVEEITAGTFKKSTLISSTAFGVGISLALGFVRVLWDIPLIFILAPAYALLLFLTLFSKDDFASLAWDAAGVTTGPVTVPLVIALGLGIGGQRGTLDSFGILTCAGLIPVATVLIAGMRLTGRQARAVSGKKAPKRGKGL